MTPPCGSPQITVVIPTRGLGAWVGRALASALASPGVLEVVFAHHRRAGEPKLDSDLLADPRVRVVESPAAGLPTARNMGMAASRGDLISFLDDDDLWLPQHLPWTLEVLSRHPTAALVARDVYLFDDPSEAADGVPPGDPSELPRGFPHRAEGPISLHDLLLANRISASAVTLVRERLEPDDRFDPTLRSVEDYDLWLRMAARHSLVFDPRPAVIVRRRRGSMMRNLRLMTEIELALVGRQLGQALAQGEMTAREARLRLGQLHHVLAYACLIGDDLGPARAALRESIPRLPWLLKNWAYAAASLLPAPARKRLFRRGRRLFATS